jgi:large subunit ribosomal protein L4
MTVEIEVKNLVASTSGTKLELPENIFDYKFNEALIHQVVTAYLSGARSGSHAQKSRSEVRGGGIKPWKQKGTGRARSGTIRSPIWRKGGVTFAAKPGDYSQKVNKKMYRGAMCSIFSELIRQDRVTVVDAFTVDDHKTKNLLSKLASFEAKKLLIILDEVSKELYLASRNLANIIISDVGNINPVNLLKCEKIIIDATAMKKLTEILG